MRPDYISSHFLTEEVTHIKKPMTDKQVVTQDVKGQPKNSH